MSRARPHAGSPAGRVRAAPAASAGLRQRASGREASVPRSEHGGSTSTRSKGSAAAKAVASPVRTSAAAAHALHGAAQGVGAARMALHGDERAAVLHQRGEMRRLAAGRGAQVEHALARPRRERAGDRHRGPRLRHEQALGPQRRVEGVERRLEHEALGQARRGVRRDAEALGELLRRRPERVRAQDGLGGLVERGHQGAGVVGAERAEPQRGDPAWVGVAQRGLGGRAVRQRGDPARGHRRRAPEHGVDELRPAGRLGLDELDGIADDGVGGDAVEEGELVEPEAERRADGRIEPLDGPAGQLLREGVQRGLALDGAVGQPRGQRAVAAVQPAAPGLAVERAIGPRVLLEDAPDHCKRACTRGGRVRGCDFRCDHGMPVHRFSERHKASKPCREASNNRPDGLKEPPPEPRTCRWVHRDQGHDRVRAEHSAARRPVERRA